MQSVRSRLGPATILGGLLTFSSPAAIRAQSPSDTPAAQQLAAPPPVSSTTQPIAAAPAPGAKKRVSKNFTLKGDSDWLDTGIDVAPGEHVIVTAKGTLRYTNAKQDNGPDGLSRGFKDLLRILPYNAAGRGALIGRVGDADIAQPFLLGASQDVAVPVGGRLSIAINQSKNDTGDGSYTVHLEIISAGYYSRHNFHRRKSCCFPARHR